MTDAQTKAWSCLREEEQHSLFLQISNGKSAWESGTILNIVHYKYLEIRERSQKFFKMFTEFFELHEAIFRPDAPVSDIFKDYIEGCIEKRLSRRDVAFYLGDRHHIPANVRTKMVEDNMDIIRTSDDPWDKDTVTLIVEFDRWNNYRILPRLYQAPSAFLRRNNKKYKIYIKYLKDKFPQWAHKKLIERFRKRVVPTSKERYYIALISRELYPETGYYVFPVLPTEEVVIEMSRFFIYIFRDKDDADLFGFMVDKYITELKSIPSCQKFWAEFRSILEDAVNYTQVNNIDFNMRTLDMAYNTHKGKNKTKNQSLKRVKEDQFYL